MLVAHPLCGLAMKYNPALDGIRAIAVLMVMCFHAMVPRTWGGYLGVDVFFVLSGFLITSLLMAEADRTGTIHFTQFYKRRLLRLTPPLILMLIAYLMLAPIAWPNVSLRTNIRDALIALFYFSDYANAFWSIPVNLRHTWSLAVEEHFYLLWPAVMLLLLRLPSTRHRAAVLAGMYLLFTLWRIAWDLHGAHSYDITYYRFDTRLSGLTVGALLAFVLQRKPTSNSQVDIDSLALISFLVLALCTWRFTTGSQVAMTIGITCVELASLLLIYISVRGRRGLVFRLLSNPPIVFIGRMSYGLYLWHYPIFHFMWDHFRWYVTLPAGGAIALLLSVISYYTVERIVRKRFGTGRTLLRAQTGIN